MELLLLKLNRTHRNLFKEQVFKKRNASSVDELALDI